jgi:uncharacterized iron-regulated membrane protein
MTPRRVLVQLHLWMGMACGLYLCVVCLTGAALVFRLELQRAEYPRLFTPVATGPGLEPDVILERVRTAYPSGRVAGVDAPTAGRATYLAYVMNGPQFATVLVDPADGTILGELPDRTWVRLLQDLHFQLLAGRTGRVVNGIGAICLCLLTLTGLLVWWPGAARWRSGFTVDVTMRWRRVVRDLHGAMGVWSAAWLMTWAVSGIAFIFPAPFRGVVQWFSPITVQRQPSIAPVSSTTAPVSWSRLLDAARRAAPGQHIARVVVPSAPTSPFVVLFSPTAPTPLGALLTPVYLDPTSGRILMQPGAATRTAGDVVMAWLGPLHFGNFAGGLVKVLWLLFGVSPPLLFGTGFVMWWFRVVRPRAIAAGPRRA